MPVFRLSSDPLGTTSNPITFDWILASESSIDNLFMQAKVKRGRGDWIQTAFSTLRRLREESIQASVEGTRLVPGYESDEQKLKILHAYHDCWDVITALKGFPATGLDGETLKEKLTTVLTGSSSRFAPNGKGSAGRNALFELGFLSDLLRAGIQAQLQASNPDIKATVDERSYFIECKRLSSQSPKALSSRIHEASNQIDRVKPANDIGVIAVSVGDFIAGEHGLLLANNEEEAASAAERLMKSFVYKNQRIWHDPNIVSSNVTGLVFYGSFIAQYDHNELPAQVVYWMLCDGLVLGNGFPPELAQFALDFQRLLSPKNGR